MPQAEWDALERELKDLARRVARIESLLGQPAEMPAARPPAEPHPLAATSNLLPILGRALLGLAGAYLLRALTDADTLPPELGVAAGLLYAIFWLVWAARTPASHRLEPAIHSLTSVLVLSPLLWEATLRFHAISPWVAGAILLCFTVTALAVSWRKDLLIVATIATLAGLGTAGALLVATHNVLPFTFVFLAIGAAVEASACLKHWLTERWLAAVAADFSVLLATWLVTNERGLPEVYAPIPHAWLLVAQVTLLAIYLSSIIIRTLFRGFTFTAFETAQCAIAFLIGLTGALRLGRTDPRIATVTGIVTLVCAAACYLLSFALLEHRHERSRNFYTYSSFGILLALTGSLILLSGTAAASAWLVASVACVWAGRITLQVHGVIYLLLAIGFSGAGQQAVAFLLGAASWPGPRQIELWAGAAAAAIAFFLATRLPRAILAAIAIFLAAGILAGVLTAMYHGAFGETASHAYCATLRTSVLAAAALLMAWFGARRNVPELSRLIYPAMILGGYRLLAYDLHQDRKAALFLSLLIYGATLTVLPRLKKATPAGES